MNVFNRAVVALQIVLLIVLLIVSAVVPNTVLRRIGGVVEGAQTALQLSWPRSYVVFLFVAIVLIFLLILLLWLELRPQTANRVVVRGRDGTRTEVSTRSVALTLQKQVDEIDDVFNVKSSVRGKRGGVEVLLNLETSPEIDIPAKMEVVSKAARELIEGKMGLKVANISVHVKPASNSGAKKAIREPTVPSPAAVSPDSAAEGAAPEAATGNEPIAKPSADDSNPYKGF